METILYYLATVFTIALPLALFEIWLERFKTGWGGNFREGSFWGKTIDVRLLQRLVGETMSTPYHLITFLGAVPALYAAALYLLNSRIPHGRIIWPIFIAAIQFGIMMVEDVLWFVLNTVFRLRFPAALFWLLQGNAPWHPRWIEFGFVNRGKTRSFLIPDFYLTIPLGVVVLLRIQYLIVR